MKKNPKSFVEFISKVISPNLSINHEHFFRGCCTSNWPDNLIPGIYRNNQVKDEHIIFKEMILKSPNDFLNEKTTLEKLVKMQHYTLPTRLLDITSNPLVALYFACQKFNNRDKDGIVYVFNIEKKDIKYYDSDAVAIISNLAKLNLEKAKFKDENHNGFEYLIHEIKEEKPHFKRIFRELNKDDIQKVFPVKVKFNNNRIVSQSGAFLIFGIKDLASKELPAELPDYRIAKKIIIKKEIKEECLSFLKSLSINEDTLFPELEHKANILKNR